MSVADQIEGLPFAEAITFFRQKANVKTGSWLDVQGAAHAHAFSVAGAASDALLQDFRDEIDRALADGTSLDDFRKSFDEIVTKHGWSYNGLRGWRTKVIFETNMRTAYAAGRYAQLTQPETLIAFPYWIYRHSGAVHPRAQHFSWDGNAWRASDPIWRVVYPPNGFGCGCYVEPADDFDLAELGKNGADSAPDIRLPGGKFSGIDQSFEYSPGMEWLTPGSEAPYGMPPLPAGLTPWQYELPLPLPVQLPPFTGRPVPRVQLSAMDDALTATYAPWAKGLDSETLDVIALYKGNGYRVINKVLRGGYANADITAKAKLLTNALDDAVAPEDIVVWRGLRGGVLKDLRVGDTFIEHGFTSMTLSQDMAVKFAAAADAGERHLLKIRLRKGQRGVAYVNRVPDIEHPEFELLGRAKLGYRIAAFEDDMIVVDLINVEE